MLLRLSQRARPRLLAGLVLLALALGLAACAERPIKPPPTPATPKRVCLWLFWSKDPGLIKQAQALMAQGKPFQAVAIDLARNNPGLAKTNADCMDTSKLEVELAHALQGLKLGQVSQPFEINQGTALAMHTSDRFRRKAKAYYDQGKYEQAARELRLDLDLHPAAAGSWHLLALCLAATGDKQGAVEAFERALEWTPRDPTLLNDKATTLQAMGRGDEALKLYRQALDREPDNPVFMNNLAWALVQENKNLAEAEKLAARAARQAADQASIWDTLGQVQQARGRHAQAVVSFYKAARLDPGYPQIRARLTRSLLAMKPQEVARLTDPAAPPPPLKAKPAPPPPPPATKPEPPPAPAPAKPAPPVKAETPAPVKAAPPPQKVARVKGPQEIMPSAWPQPGAQTQPSPAPADQTKAAPPPLKPTVAPPAPPPAEPAPKPKLRDDYRPPPKLAPKLLPKKVAQPKPPAVEPAPPTPTRSKPFLASRAVSAAGSGGSKVKGRMPPPPDEGREAAQSQAAPATPVVKPSAKVRAPVVDAPAKSVTKPVPPPPPPPAASTTPSQAVVSGFYLQVASFKAAGMAAKGVKEWQQAGYPALVRPWSSDTATWYRVMLGPYGSKQAALDLAGKLKEEGLINYFVINEFPDPAKPAPAPAQTAAQAPEPTTLVKPAPPALQPRPQPTPAPPPTAAPSQAEAPRFYLQVASFKKAGMADKGVKEWQQAGYPALVRPWSSEKGTWYRVMLGPYDSKQQALDLARKLSDEGLISFFVINQYPDPG